MMENCSKVVYEERGNFLQFEFQGDFEESDSSGYSSARSRLPENLISNKCDGTARKLDFQ